MKYNKEFERVKPLTSTLGVNLNELSLFSGGGGGLLATQHLLGWKTIGYVEINDYCQRVIAQRIQDGFLDNAPIFTDIRTFVDSGCCDLYQGITEVITAGFPCQPFSQGSSLRLGSRDPRNMLPYTIECIRLVGPEKIFVENVPAWTRFRAFGFFLGALAEVGYCVSWDCISAADLGLHHKRERIWVASLPMQSRWSGPLCRNSENSIQQKWKTGSLDFYSTPDERIRSLEKSMGEPSISGNPDGVAHRVDRLKAPGEGQVPQVAATAWGILTNT